MDSNVNKILQNIVNTATLAADEAKAAVHSAGKAVAGKYDEVKMNIELARLSDEQEDVFSDIGRMLFLMHTGAVKDTVMSDEGEKSPQQVIDALLNRQRGIAVGEFIFRHNQGYSIFCVVIFWEKDPVQNVLRKDVFSRFFCGEKDLFAKFAYAKLRRNESLERVLQIVQPDDGVPIALRQMKLQPQYLFRKRRINGSAPVTDRTAFSAENRPEHSSRRGRRC